MGIQCPKCGGEHVQAIRVILQSGTSFSNGTVTGVGVGDGATGYVGTVSSTSKTTLAARFSPPIQPALWPVVAQGAIALASSPWLQAHGPDVGWRYLSLALWANLAHSVWSYRRKSAAYKVEIKAPSGALLTHQYCLK
jgi:hypothetical protein